MKLNDIEAKKFKTLAKGVKGTALMEYMERVKTEVSDIRNPMNVKPEFDRDVRMAVCDVLDELIINNLKKLAGDYDPSDDNWA